MSKLVYVAGRYTGKDMFEVEGNVRAAKAVALELGRRRIQFICPVIHTAHFESYLGDEDPGYDFWIGMTMEMLRRCDAVFLVSNWKQSKGATAEFEFARANGTPIFDDFETLDVWYRKASASPKVPLR